VKIGFLLAGCWWTYRWR